MVGALNVFLFIMIVSFVIDRVVRALLFLLSFLGRWVYWLDDVAKLEDETVRVEALKRQKLTYSLIAAVIGVVFVWNFEEIRVLKLLIGNSLDNKSPDDKLDFFVTWMTVIGGSDFVGRILSVSGIGDIGGGPTTNTQPIEITGKLTLENADRKEVKKSSDN